MSMVMLIIGLVIGGVIVGNDLIRHSKLNRIMTQVNSFVTSANTFRLKYDCVPGDCQNAVAMLGASADGNGNGNIEGIFGSGEEFYFWEQLGLAGLINGKYIGTANPPEYWSYRRTWQVGYNAPPTGINEKSFFRIFYVGLVSNVYNHSYHLGDLGTIIATFAYCTNSFAGCATGTLSGKDGSYIDKKYDDSNSWFGNIQAIINSTCNGTDPAYGGNGKYITDSTTTPTSCAMVFKTKM